MQITHNALNDVLLDITRAQQAARRATATVSWEVDPKMPGRTAYRITGATRDVVQGAIDGRMVAAENRDGRATFVGPYRNMDGWVAIGEVVLSATVVA